MIYFLMFTGLAIFTDYKCLKGCVKKSNLVFYISFVVIALTFAIYYYSNENGIKLAEIIIKLFNLEEM